MFKFLKDKLKKAVTKFVKTAEEEIVEEQVEDIKVIEQAKAEEKKREAKRKKAVELEDTAEAKAARAKETLRKRRPAPKKEKPKKEKESEPEDPLSEVEAPLRELAKAEKEKKAADEPKGLMRKKVRPSEVAITYFVHGTTIDNEHHLATGQQDGELSDLGQRQSKELASRLTYTFDEIFTSDLKRAKESAALTWPDRVLVADKRLRECDYGLYTLHENKDIDDYIAENGTEKEFPNGESLKDVEERVKEFLNHLYKNYKGKHVAIIAHRWTQNAIEVLLNGKTWKQAIKSDWRKRKAWQPGWEYTITKPLIEKEECPPEQVVKEDGTIIEDVTPLEPEVQDREEILEEGPELQDQTPPVEKEPERGVQEAKKPKRILGIFKKKEKPAEPKPEMQAKGAQEESVVEPAVAEPVVEPEKKGFFGKVRESFTKKRLSEEKFEELFWELELSMLENNVAVEVIEKIKQDLKQELTAGKVTRKGIEQLILESLRDSVEELFVEPYDLLRQVQQSKKRPYIVCFVGVNGSGKTTTLAKVANMFQQNELSVVMAASDTFRAAAIDQLQEHADRLAIKLISQGYGADPAAVAYDAIEHAKARNIDVVMIDTAGRLHSNTNLMAELEKVVRVAKPDLKIFIGESITGNDCVEQAKEFNKIVGIDAIILSKADVDEKGGAAISVSYVTGKPILYLGVGQAYGDLEPFDKEKIIESMGL